MTQLVAEDIVERLRVQDEDGLLNLPDGFEYVSYGDAAEEIEGLRKALAALVSCVESGSFEEQGLALDAARNRLPKARP